MWSILQQNVYKTRITDLDNFKHRIRTEWAKLDHAVIAAAVRQWRRHLSACVGVGGGHFFEHCFNSDNSAAFKAFVHKTEQLQADIPV